MTATAESTREELLALYQVAARVLEAQPWKSMYDSDLFGVRSPETGLVGYCSVMGFLGQYHALQFFMGGEGITGYMALRDSFREDAAECDEMSMTLTGHSQTCIGVEYVNASEIGREGKALVKSLGLSFRGRHAWPTFLRTDPGLEPARLDRGEVAFLTVALEQALVVAARYREDESVVTGPLESDRVLVRVPVREGDTITWRDAVEPFEVAPVPEPEPLSAGVVNALQALPGRSGDVELAHTFLPGIVKERKKDRGMCLRLLLLVDPASGLVMAHHFFDENDYPRRVLARLAELFMSAAFRPDRLVLSDRRLHAILEAHLTLPQVSLRLVPRMRASEAAYAALCRRMAR